jgi:Ca2+-binding EF-hand superfamily protein
MTLKAVVDQRSQTFHMEPAMKNSIYALALAALAASLPYGAAAQDAAAARGEALFVRIDADKSGEISLSEFVAAGNPRVKSADKDNDGKASLEELTATFKAANAGERAGQFMKRFDTDKDGAVALAEVDAWRTTRYAKLDADKDGKLTKDEMLKPAKK